MRGLVKRAGFGRTAVGRWVAALALSATVMLSALPACAEEGGFFGFLSSALGGGSAPTAAPAPAPAASEGERVRPLTVRRAPKKPGSAAARAATGRARMARLPGRTGPVSIYEDRTLRDGDAVMTKDGMKVFAGGRFSPERPYGDANFIAVSASKAIGPNLRKAVIELNKLPHG